MLRGAAATEALGRALGAALRVGDLLALEGELGAGKTTLVRGLAAGMGIDPADVHSPTFVLHHVYRGPRVTLHHLDAYRVGAGAALLAEVDIEELRAEGAVALEWAEFVPLDGSAGAARVRLEAPSPELRVARLGPDAPAHVLSAFPTEASGT